MGGVVSRYYLQRLGGLARVRRFVTISSPHHGTVTAYLRRLPERGPADAARQRVAPRAQPRRGDAGADRRHVHPDAPLDLDDRPPDSSRLPVGREVPRRRADARRSCATTRAACAPWRPPPPRRRCACRARARGWSVGAGDRRNIVFVEAVVFIDRGGSRAPPPERSPRSRRGRAGAKDSRRRDALACVPLEQPACREYAWLSSRTWDLRANFRTGAVSSCSREREREVTSSRATRSVDR